MSRLPDATTGAVESFDDFYRREFPRAVGLALALTGDGAVAEDLAQEALVTAHRKWDRIRNYDNPGAWVRRVLTNRAISHHRRRRSQWRTIRRWAAREQLTTTIPELPPDTDELWAAVRELPGRQARAIALFYVDELSLAEIGEVLGCAPGTVKTHLHRARTRLGERLGARQEEQ